MKPIITLSIFLLLSNFLFAGTAGDLNTAWAGGGFTAVSPGNYGDLFQKTFLQTDGKILVLGTRGSSMANYSEGYVQRLNADGTPDQSFGYGGAATVFGVSLTDAAIPRYITVGLDGKIVIAGMVTGSDMDLFVAQLFSDGTFDTTFNGTGILRIQNTNSYDEIAAGLAVRSDGKIIIAENASANTVPYFALMRLNGNGTFDFSYGTLGTVVFSQPGKAVNVREIINDEVNNRIYALGGLQNLSPPEEYPFVAAFNDLGPDSTFGFYGFNTLNSTHSGISATAAIWKNNNGFAVAMGNYGIGESYVYHFSPLGLADNSYTTTHLQEAYIESLVQQPNGQIVYGGRKIITPYTSSMVVGRLQYYGQIDSSFGKIGHVNYIFNYDSIESAQSLQITSDGNILGGTTYHDNTTAEDFIVFQLIPENVAEIHFAAFSSSFMNVPLGTTSSVGTTTIHAEWAPAAITISATQEFEISTDNLNWGQSFVVNQNNFDTSATQDIKLFFRFHPSSTGTKTGYIYNECPGMLPTWNDTIRLTGSAIPSVGIVETEREKSFTIYPNPTQNILMIRTNDIELENTTLQIFDLTGREILEKEISLQQTSIDVSSFTNGIYLLKCGSTVKRFEKF